MIKEATAKAPIAANIQTKSLKSVCMFYAYDLVGGSFEGAACSHKLTFSHTQSDNASIST